MATIVIRIDLEPFSVRQAPVLEQIFQSTLDIFESTLPFGFIYSGSVRTDVRCFLQSMPLRKPSILDDVLRQAHHVME
jgi:hypothetical protein